MEVLKTILCIAGGILVGRFVLAPFLKVIFDQINKKW